PLVPNEAVLEILIIGVSTLDLNAFFFESRDDLFFHRFLCRPTFLIGGESQVPTGDQNRFVGFDRCGLMDFGYGISCHRMLLKRLPHSMGSEITNKIRSILRR